MSELQSPALERTATPGKPAQLAPETGITARGSATPEELALIVRDQRCDRTHRTPRWWLANDPVATEWYNSVSASLPRGEAFFIDSLKLFRDGLPPRLARELKAFTRQEIKHTRQHVAFNRRVQDNGYVVETIARGITEIGGAWGRERGYQKV